MTAPAFGCDDEPLRVSSDQRRVAAYRRLQSWYREEQLGVREPGTKPDGSPLGSALPVSALASRPDLNFLTPAAYRNALDRAIVVRRTGGTLEEDRLYRNMLSSMPLCFNIFGSLGTHPAFVRLIQALVDSEASIVGAVSCEWAPPSRLSDSSATTSSNAVWPSSADSQTQQLPGLCPRPTSSPRSDRADRVF